MEHNEPTLSSMGRSVPGTHVPPASDMPDAAADLAARSEVPTWPGAVERAQWMPALGPRQRQQAPAGYVSTLAFGISLGANVVLLAVLLGMFLLSQIGAFALGGASGPSTSAGSTHGVALSSPTTTASPASSPAAGVGWLQVTPSSVRLGCGDSHRTQVVLIENSGPQTVDWQVAFFVPQDQAGIAVNPQQGELAAGDSVSVQLQNRTQSSGQQGVIDFAPTTSDAGPPATLTYMTVGCG